MTWDCAIKTCTSTTYNFYCVHCVAVSAKPSYPYEMSIFGIAITVPSELLLQLNYPVSQLYIIVVLFVL
jgi:hypothetical protein